MPNKQIVYVVFTTTTLKDCVLPSVIGVYSSYDDADFCANHYYDVHGVVAFFEEFSVK